MRIKELSTRSGVSVPTIKYYLREGLLPAGALTSPNQADYNESHLRRLGLIRAMVDVGGLTLATVREVLTAADTPDLTASKVLFTAQESISPQPEVRPGTNWQEAEQTLKTLTTQQNWQTKPDSRAWQAAVAVLVSAKELGHDIHPTRLAAYAQACEQIAKADLDYVLETKDQDTILEGVVIGTVLGDTLLTSLRRLAHQSESKHRLTTPN